MLQNTVTLAALPEIEFSVTKTTLDAVSSLNQHDSHAHSVCEVYINLTGDVAFSVENRIYSVSRGSVILTMPYEFHHCIYRSNTPHSHYWITFTPVRDADFLRIFFHREKGTQNRIDLDEAALKDICQILDDLIAHPGSSLQRQIQILRFFQILTQGVVAQPETMLENLPRDVTDALSFMDQHLAQELDIATVAEACHVSVNTLERHFQERLGISPFAMLRKKRLFASMLHLQNGCSVTEAAIRSGFPDYSNYIQLFRKQFGMTPGKYRRQIHRGDSV